MDERVVKIEELREDIIEALGEMEELISNISDEVNPTIIQRAEAYWLTSVRNMLTYKAGSYLGSMHNYGDTLKEIKGEIS